MSQQDASPATHRTPVPAPPLAAQARGRRHERRSLDSALEIEVVTKSLGGMADNISRVGLMVYTDQPLRVSVQIDGVHGGRPMTGRLIRLQRMDDTMTGVAIEFDELIEFDQGD